MHMNTHRRKTKTGQKKFYINCYWEHRFKNFASEKTNKSRDKLCSFTINSGLTWNNYFIYKNSKPIPDIIHGISTGKKLYKIQPIPFFESIYQSIGKKVGQTLKADVIAFHKHTQTHTAITVCV